MQLIALLVSADYLVTKYGAKKLCFSKYVYKIASLIQEILSLEIKKDPQLLQYIGKLRNIYGENIFIKAIENEITNNTVVADCRFKNEAQFLKEKGFLLVKIDRNDRPIDRDQTDISECDLDDYKFDYVISNNDTREALYKNIDTIIQKCLK